MVKKIVSSVILAVIVISYLVLTQKYVYFQTATEESGENELEHVMEFGNSGGESVVNCKKFKVDTTVDIEIDEDSDASLEFLVDGKSVWNGTFSKGENSVHVGSYKGKKGVYEMKITTPKDIVRGQVKVTSVEYIRLIDHLRINYLHI